MPDWLTQSVIYEINTATFSPAGDFASVTARLGDLETSRVLRTFRCAFKGRDLISRKVPLSNYARLQTRLTPSFEYPPWLGD